MVKKKTTDPPEVIELFEAIANLFADADGFDGVIVRNVGAKYATKKDFFSGAGAAKFGGRWNPVGLEAIYASLDVITATHEAYQNFQAFGFPLTTIEPRVTAGGKVSPAKVLDLTNAKVRSKLGLSLKELMDEDWKAIQSNGEESWTQAIGRGLLSLGDKKTLELRDVLAMARPMFGRVVDVSERTIADAESGKTAKKLMRNYNEVYRLVEALSEVVDRESLGLWFRTPNESFDGLKPIEVIERGEIDRL